MKTKYIYAKYKVACALILFSLILSFSISAQQIAGNQQNLILSGVTGLLEKYQQYGQLTIDGVQLSQEYINEFALLFDRNKFKGIDNDLSVKGASSVSSFNLPEEYITYARTFFPQGLDLSLDLKNLTILESSTENGSYLIIVKVMKQLRGLFNGTKIHNYNNDFYFFITVPETSLENVKDYKISGILLKERYAKFIASRKSKGLYVGLTGAYDFSRIFSSPVYESGIWTYSLGSSFNPQIDITYMIANGLGFGTGIGISGYGSSFTILDYNKTSPAIMNDIDGDTYNPVLQISSLTENNYIRCVEFPFLLKSRMGTGSTKFYFDLGIVISFVSKSYFTLEGSSVIKGYYPQYKVILMDLPEYGFGTYDYSPALENEMTLTKQLLSAHAAMGFSFNIGKSFFLKIGARMNYGLTDLGFNTVRHSNDFNNLLSDDITSTLQSLGAEIGLSYKIF